MKCAARASHWFNVAHGMLSPLSIGASGPHFSRAGREPKGKEPLPNRGKSPPIKMDPEKYDVMNGVGGRGYSDNRPRSGSIYDDGRERGGFPARREKLHGLSSFSRHRLMTHALMTTKITGRRC